MLKFKRTPVSDFIRIEEFVSVFSRKLQDISAPDFCTDGEAHDFWEFLHLESGELNILVDGRLFCLQPGDLIIYAPYSFHITSVSSKAVVNICAFSASSSVLPQFANAVIPLSDTHMSSLYKIMELGRATFSLPKDISDERGMCLRNESSDFSLQKLANLTELFLIGLFEEKLSGKLPEHTTNKSNLNKEFSALTTFLQNNMHRPLTTEEICSELLLSPSQLGKLCRDVCGCGPIDYLISLKIGLAKRLIHESALNLTQISERLGFSSVHYFSRLFKSKTGISPSDYKKAHTSK